MATYDSKDVNLTIDTVKLEGFGPNKVTISRNNDITSYQSGVDGEPLFSKNNDKSGTISFELTYGTDYDTLLDQLSNFNFPFAVGFDHLISGKALVTYGMLAAQPDIVLGQEPDYRTWTINVVSVDMSVDGQASELIAGVTPYEL